MAGCVWTLVKILLYFVREAYRKLCGKQPQPDYSPDIVLVTGAAKGIGRALATQFSEYGATVVVWDVDEEGLRSLSEELSAKNREVFSYVVDCSKREEIYRAAEKVREEVGNVAVVVNNAAILSGKNFLDLTDEEIEKSFSLNTLGYIWVSSDATALGRVGVTNDSDPFRRLSERFFLGCWRMTTAESFLCRAAPP